jgi:hypothetical protein
VEVEEVEGEPVEEEAYLSPEMEKDFNAFKRRFWQTTGINLTPEGGDEDEPQV